MVRQKGQGAWRGKQENGPDSEGPKDGKGTRCVCHKSPYRAPYPILVEGSEHALHILGGLLVAGDLEEALKLVHEQCPTGTLHHKLLVPLLQLRHVHLPGSLHLLPAELLPHLGFFNVRESSPVPPRPRLTLGSGPLALLPWFNQSFHCLGETGFDW